jgi:hypothetical protein
MLRKLRPLAELSLPEFVLFSQLVFLSILVRAGLRLVSFPRLIALFTSCANHARLRRLPLLHNRFEWNRIVALVELAARGTSARGPCLVRSLLLFWLLMARGEPAEILIGVSKETSHLEAHAWIETQGKVVGDSAAVIGRFATLLRLSAKL